MINKKIAYKLDQKNTKPTSMRLLVYDFLASHDAAISISDIEMALKTADRTTIYRTLKTFEKKGIVHQVQEENISKYVLCHDGCNEEGHKDWHLHFFCKICQQTFCREDFILPKDLTKNLRVDEVRLFAKGICEKCLTE